MRRLIGLRAIFIFLGIIFLSANIVFAASLPVPAGTKVIREENVEQTGREYKMLFCESGLSQEKVISFYRKELSAQGYSILLNTDKMQMYKKEGKTFMVAVSANPEGKTNIILTEGIGLAALGKAAQSGGTPDCEDLPNVPVYPGARCLASTKMKNARSTSQRFSADADAYRIADFYRQQMPRYGWYIDKEVDISQALANRGNSAGGGGLGGLDLEGAAQMSFKDDQGVECVITVMPAVTGKGSTINIIYNESKRQ